MGESKKKDEHVLFGLVDDYERPRAGYTTLDEAKEKRGVMSKRFKMKLSVRKQTYVKGILVRSEPVVPEDGPLVLTITGMPTKDAKQTDFEQFHDLLSDALAMLGEEFPEFDWYGDVEEE